MKRSDSDTEFHRKRLANFAPLVSRLSDQYAMHDDYYGQTFNADIQQICDAINDHNNSD